MPRTRDYLLMISATAFLLMAISVTAVKPFQKADGVPALVYSATENEALYNATLSENVPSRSDRIKELRDKISKQKDIFITAALPEPTQTEVEQVPIEEEEAKVENRCPGYRTFTLPWNNNGILIEEVEGARLVYRNVPNPVTPTTASGTIPEVPVFVKQSLVQLPLASLPNKQSSCLPTDVIGIANSGALIKNSEIGFYSEFGGQTLIGYALDGFPLYGTANTATDACGGFIVNGQYRYHLSSERTVMINCFAGSPVSF